MDRVGYQALVFAVRPTRYPSRFRVLGARAGAPQSRAILRASETTVDCFEVWKQHRYVRSGKSNIESKRMWVNRTPQYSAKQCAQVPQ